jgi:hypothetical protein
VVESARRRPGALAFCALNRSGLLPITVTMSMEATIARVDAIRRALSDPAELLASGGVPAATGGTEAPGAQAAPGAAAPFAAALAQAQAPDAQAGAYGATAGAGVGAAALEPGMLAGGLDPVDSQAGGAGGRIVAAAESQIGESEQPPGSNEGPAIAAYRAATAGAMPGEPWCAYFASWAARQAGEPLGPAGEGLGSVGEIWSWAQSSGRAIPNGPGVVPQPGDLIVFGDEHVGIVRGVLPDGRIATIEGNFENKVSANTRSASEATGYVNISASQ